MPYSFPGILVETLRAVRGDVSDDAVDRLNSVLTVWVVVFFAALVGAGQYFGTPIKCMPSQDNGRVELHARLWQSLSHSCDCSAMDAVHRELLHGSGASLSSLLLYRD